MLDELLVGLGFEFDPEDIEKFNSELDKGINLVSKLGTAVVAGTAALVGFSTVVTAATDRQGKLSEETDIAVGMIDALSFSLSRVGGDSNSLEGDIRSLSIAVSEASRGVGSAVEAFGILGISATDAQGNLKPTVDVLMEVADAIQNLPRSQQYELANKVGLGNSIRLLQQGSDGIRELISEAEALGVATEEDAAISADFQDGLTNLAQISKQFSRTLSRELTPILESVTNTIEDWWKQNRQLIEQRLPTYIGYITTALKLLTIATAGFIALKFVGVLLSMVKAFKAVQLSALLANAAIAALPALIATIVAGIGLLAEDANVFFEGGESFIGNMIKKYPQWADELRTVAAIFATIYDLTSMVFEGWGLIFDLFSTDLKTHILAFKMIMSDIGEYITGIFDNTVQSIENLFIGLWEGVKRKFEENVMQPISNGIDKIGNFFSFGQDEENTDAEFLNNVQNTINSESSDLGASGLTRSDTRNNISNSVSLGGIKVEVNNQGSGSIGRAEAQQIARDINTELQPIFEQASRDLNSTVEL